MRLFKPEEQVRFQNRAHFFGAAAEAMRRILIGSARRKKRIKNGGLLERVDVDAIEVPLPMPEDELIALDEALDELATVHARAAEVVKLCFYVGLTQAETAREVAQRGLDAGKQQVDEIRSRATQKVGEAVVDAVAGGKE